MRTVGRVTGSVATNPLTTSGTYIYMQMRLKIEGNNNKSSANKIASAKWMKVLECQWRKFLKKLAVACEAWTRARERQRAAWQTSRWNVTSAALCAIMHNQFKFFYTLWHSIGKKVAPTRSISVRNEYRLPSKIEVNEILHTNSLTLLTVTEEGLRKSRGII